MHFLDTKNFSARGRPREAAPPSVNLGPPHTSETIRDRKLKFYTHLDGPSTLFRYDKFSTRGRARRVQGPLVQIWDPPYLANY